MKEYKNENQIEEAIAMYKVNVSPSRDALINVLNQIPEKEMPTFSRVRRSPYMWFAIQRFSPVFMFLMMIIPAVYSSNLDEDYLIDLKSENFEISLDNADYLASLNDYKY